MKKISLSTKIYILLVIILAVSNAIQVLLPSYASMLPPAAQLPASIPVLALANAGIAIVLYGPLGYAGLVLSCRLGFPDIWEPNISNRQRFFIPAVIGALLGLFLIVSDGVFSRNNGVGRFPHPTFPASIFASLSAGIGEEIIFRLFFIPLWVWLISSVFLRGRWRNQVFWVINIVAALSFALGHLPTVMLLFDFKTISEIPLILIAEIILLNGFVAIYAGYYLRKYGFLAAAGVHFWTDIVWHVIWGLF